MSELIKKSTNWAVWIIIIVLVLGGIWLFNEKQKMDDCKDRALEAAIDVYPIDDYPDTSERAKQQAEYEQRYISQNCNNK